MATITHYLAHDPVSNTEGIITEFDATILNKAAESGIVFIAVDDEGNRSIVSASEVKKPDSTDETFRIVQPMYVDDRMKAVVDVFDALASSVPAAASTLAVQSAAGKARTKMTFAEALEALRLLAYGTNEEGGE